MAEKKKLQVFVSSTYIDLKEERQAAVQAILTAGHIPAGMELFSAGDQSQMDVIRRWIDESDVFLLILGGRYGSIESESQKSYTHLEYEYALERGKALFAVVITENHLEEKIKQHGKEVIETKNSDKLEDFRSFVCSKMVRPWSDSKDIKLAILETLSEFSRREELIGWIPGNQAVNTGELAEELARLAKENSELRAKLSSLDVSELTYNGLTYEELYQLLNSEKTLSLKDLDEYIDEYYDHPSVIQKVTVKRQIRHEIEIIEQTALSFGDSEASLIHAFWALRGEPTFLYETRRYIIQPINKFGLFTIENTNNGTFVKLNDYGQRFLLRLTHEINQKIN